MICMKYIQNITLFFDKMICVDTIMISVDSYTLLRETLLCLNLNQNITFFNNFLIYHKVKRQHHIFVVIVICCNSQRFKKIVFTTIEVRKKDE